jgi:hypothetical protein
VLPELAIRLRYEQVFADAPSAQHWMRFCGFVGDLTERPDHAVHLCADLFVVSSLSAF